MSDLVGNPEDRFSRVAAHIIITICISITDAFLPHIVDLATKSSDRQTKVAACELLHSLIIYCLGRSAQQPGTRVERASMAGLYVKLFPAMLKLACDVEQVSCYFFVRVWS